MLFTRYTTQLGQIKSLKNIASAESTLLLVQRCADALAEGCGDAVARPRAKLDASLCRYTGVTRKVPFKLRPKDRKGAPLCRYTGVTRKVPLSSAPKIGKRCPIY